MKILYVLGFLVLLSHLSVADEYSGAVQSLQENFAVRQLSHEKHRGYILDHGSKTDKVLVLIHALYESPAYIRGVANSFYEAGYNVIVPVLAGHWESPLEKLDDATGSEWIQDTAEVIAHAKLMGSSLIVGGHSLGGLIAVYRAMKDPSIDGLVLWSPAMKLSNKVWFGSYIGWLLKDLKRLDGNWLAGKPPKDGVNVPYYSVAVGVEVARLGKQLLSDFTTIHHPSWWVNADSSELYESLKMPVAVIGTSSDDIISFEEEIKLADNLGGPKLLLEYSDQSHSSICKTAEDCFPGSMKSNPHFEEMMDKILKFLQ